MFDILDYKFISKNAEITEVDVVTYKYFLVEIDLEITDKIAISIKNYKNQITTYINSYILLSPTPDRFDLIIPVLNFSRKKNISRELSQEKSKIISILLLLEKTHCQNAIVLGISSNLVDKLSYDWFNDKSLDFFRRNITIMFYVKEEMDRIIYFNPKLLFGYIQDECDNINKLINNYEGILESQEKAYIPYNIDDNFEKLKVFFKYNRIIEFDTIVKINNMTLFEIFATSCLKKELPYEQYKQ